MAFTNGVAPPAKRHVLFHLAGLEITSHTVQWTALGIASTACSPGPDASAARCAGLHAHLQVARLGGAAERQRANMVLNTA
ncbi:MAG: hypothetical protein WDN08_06405 [Rhizomicrobium sp.]